MIVAFAYGGLVVDLVLGGRDGMLLLLHVLVELRSHLGQRPDDGSPGLW
jgi:hypothetical protein